MRGLVKRQDAVDAVKRYFEGLPIRARFDLIDAMMALPSAGQQWIPCSERLPNEDGDYLVSGKWTDSKFGVHEVVGECEYSVEDGYFDAMWSFDVLAWMPMPEPYKGGQDEQQENDIS